MTPPPGTLSAETSQSEVGTSRLARFAEEITELLHQDLDASVFHAEFLKRLVATLRAVAGAIWLRNAQGEFTLQYQINLAEIGLDKIAGARACHAELLAQAASAERPLWLPPQTGPSDSPQPGSPTNLTTQGLLLTPIRVEDQTLGLIEIWLEYFPESQTWKPAARFLQEAAGFPAAYLHRERFRQLQDQQKFWAQLEAYLRRLHSCLDLPRVANWVANEGRLLLECDQLSVAVRRGHSTRIAAISGVQTIDPRARLVRAQQKLVERVLLWGEKLLFIGNRDASLPPGVFEALDAYLTESPARLLVVWPLRDPRDEPNQPARSALVVEQFQSGSTYQEIQSRLEPISPHTAAALYNAIEVDGVPLSSLGRTLARLDHWLFHRGWMKVAGVLALIGLVVAALCFIPAPLRLDAKGQLLPRERQTIFAPVAGKIIEVKAASSDRVSRGQELLVMEDLENQLKIEQLTIKISAAEHRLAVLAEQLARTAAEEERDTLVKERIERRYELQKAQAERSLLSQGSRTPRRTPLTAPFAGKMVTFDAREQLLGKTVKPGDPLVRLARSQGPWEILLHLPEEHIAQVREGLHLAGEQLAIPVALLLSSQPTVPYRAWLHADGLAGETTLKEGKVVLPARMDITDPKLLQQVENLPVGVEVRARLDCGPRPVGYVWLGGLLEFLYERLWF